MLTDHEANEQAMEVGLIPPASWGQIRKRQEEVQRRAAAKQLRQKRWEAFLMKIKHLFHNPHNAT